MSRREDTTTRELGYFAIGILPNDEVRCRNCATFVTPNDDQCPGCGENVCRVCGCSESAGCVLIEIPCGCGTPGVDAILGWPCDGHYVRKVCTWSDRDRRLCSGCVR